MNIKRIVLITVILMIAISSLSMVCAGWFDNYAETNTFKFEKPENYSADIYKDSSGNEIGVFLSNGKDDNNFIIVSEGNKDNYTAFTEKDFSDDSNTDSNNITFGMSTSSEFLKEYKDDNMRIVVKKNYMTRMGYTTAYFQKDGSYYHVSIQHPYDTNLINTDIQIVKDIYNSLEKK